MLLLWWWWWWWWCCKSIFNHFPPNWWFSREIWSYHTMMITIINFINFIIIIIIIHCQHYINYGWIPEDRWSIHAVMLSWLKLTSDIKWWHAVLLWRRNFSGCLVGSFIIFFLLIHSLGRHSFVCLLFSVAVSPSAGWSFDQLNLLKIIFLVFFGVNQWLIGTFTLHFSALRWSLITLEVHNLITFFVLNFLHPVNLCLFLLTVRHGRINECYPAIWVNLSTKYV